MINKDSIHGLQGQHSSYLDSNHHPTTGSPFSPQWIEAGDCLGHDPPPQATCSAAAAWLSGEAAQVKSPGCVPAGGRARGPCYSYWPACRAAAGLGGASAWRGCWRHLQAGQQAGQAALRHNAGALLWRKAGYDAWQATTLGAALNSCCADCISVLLLPAARLTW